MSPPKTRQTSETKISSDLSGTKRAAIDLLSVFVYVLVAAAMVGQVAFVVWVVNA